MTLQRFSYVKSSFYRVFLTLMNFDNLLRTDLSETIRFEPWESHLNRIESYGVRFKRSNLVRFGPSKTVDKTEWDGLDYLLVFLIIIKLKFYCMRKLLKFCVCTISYRLNCVQAWWTWLRIWRTVTYRLIT